MGIVDHIRKYIGEPDEVHGLDPNPQDLHVLTYFNTPCQPYNTYLSLGLGRHILDLGDSRDVRMELIITAHSKHDNSHVRSFLLTLLEYVLRPDSEHRALLQGQVIGPYSPVIEETKMNSVYVSQQWLFDDSFTVYEESDPPTVVAAIVPIYESECMYVKTHGWSNFEEILEEEEPDLFDWDRAPLSNICPSI